MEKIIMCLFKLLVIVPMAILAQNNSQDLLIQQHLLPGEVYIKVETYGTSIPIPELRGGREIPVEEKEAVLAAEWEDRKEKLSEAAGGIAAAEIAAETGITVDPKKRNNFINGGDGLFYFYKIYTNSVVNRYQLDMGLYGRFFWNFPISFNAGPTYREVFKENFWDGVEPILADLGTHSIYFESNNKIHFHGIKSVYYSESTLKVGEKYNFRHFTELYFDKNEPVPIAANVETTTEGIEKDDVLLTKLSDFYQIDDGVIPGIQYLSGCVSAITFCTDPSRCGTLGNKNYQRTFSNLNVVNDIVAFEISINHFFTHYLSGLGVYESLEDSRKKALGITEVLDYRGFRINDTGTSNMSAAFAESSSIMFIE